MKVPMNRPLCRAAGAAAFRALTILALAFGMPAAHAAIVVKGQLQGTVHDAWFATSFNAATGIAVGAEGAVGISQDGGATWKIANLPTNGLSLLGVHADSNVRVAVGQGGLIFRQPGSGEWSKVDSGTEKRLFAVAGSDAGLMLAGGEFGSLLLSEDAGEHWRLLPLDWSAFTEGGAEPHLYATDVEADGTLFAVGEFGLILRSADRGRTWTQQHKGDASLFAIQIREDGVGFAVGQDGTILKSVDHGLNWADTLTGTKSILLSVAMGGQGQVVVSGMRDMLASSDDGAGWERVSDPMVTTQWFSAVARGRPEEFLAVGQGGAIIQVTGVAEGAIAPTAVPPHAAEPVPAPDESARADAMPASSVVREDEGDASNARAVDDVPPAPPPRPKNVPAGRRDAGGKLTAWWPSNREAGRLNLMFAGEAAFGSAITLLFDGDFASADSVNSHVKVLNANGSPVSGKWIVTQNRRMLAFRARPGRYTIVMDGTLEDGAGRRLSAQLHGPVAILD